MSDLMTNGIKPHDFLSLVYMDMKYGYQNKFNIFSSVGYYDR